MSDYFQQLLKQAEEALRRNQTSSAKSIYEQILAVDPNQAQANHNLGVVLWQADDRPRAIECFRLALQVQPSEGQFWLGYIKALAASGQVEMARSVLDQGKRQGLAGPEVAAIAEALRNGVDALPARLKSIVDMMNEGRLPDAESSAKFLTNEHPGFGDAWTVYGAVLRAQGKMQEALLPLRQAVSLMPQSAEAHCNLGALNHQLGQVAYAETEYKCAIELAPGLAEAHLFLGNLKFENGDLIAAKVLYERALTIKPNFPEALNQLGLLYSKVQEPDKAKALYLHALKLQPRLADAHFNFGLLLLDEGHLDNAELAFRAVIDIQPQNARAFDCLGGVYQKKNAYALSEDHFRRALALQPDLVEAQAHLAALFKTTGKLSEALEAFDAAIKLKGDHGALHNDRANVLVALGRRSEAMQAFKRAIDLNPKEQAITSSLLFMLGKAGIETPEAYLDEAKQWEKRAFDASDLCSANQRLFQRTSRTGRKLRIGYLSGDFRQHAVADFFMALIRFHNSARVDIWCYSTNSSSDLTTEKIRGFCHQWRTVDQLSDAQLRQQIDDDKIDVLIDLSGHTAHARLGAIALRSAPVQAHYLGYFASTGLTGMDYWIADDVLVPPGAEKTFSEIVWRLPRTWISYRGRPEAPPVKWQPAEDGSIWLGSFNNLDKLNDTTLTLWAEVLNALPNAKLLLKTKGLADPVNQEYILKLMEAIGVGRDRLCLQGRTGSWVEHMDLYNKVDIALDPVGWVGGGTTTCDALWMGVPVVTLCGSQLGQRMTASMLNALGCPEWIAFSRHDYVKTVIDLALALAKRQTLRSAQREKMNESALCDARGLANILEDSYESMFDTWWKARGNRAQL